MTAQSQDYGELRSQGVRVEGADVPSTGANRYTFERTEYGFDIVDTLTGDVVGVESTEEAAAKTVQILSALHKANEVRHARARIRREIHAAPTLNESLLVLAAVVEDNPPALASIRAEALLGWVRGMNKRRRNATLALAGCSGEKRFGELTARQRGKLCEALRTDPMAVRRAMA